VKSTNRHALSLAPLPFEEAVTDILKIKPEPRSQRKSRRQRSKKRVEVNDDGDYV
jgi:hypothetical protein